MNRSRSDASDFKLPARRSCQEQGAGTHGLSGNYSRTSHGSSSLAGSVSPASAVKRVPNCVPTMYVWPAVGLRLISQLLVQSSVMSLKQEPAKAPGRPENPCVGGPNRLRIIISHYVKVVYGSLPFVFFMSRADRDACQGVPERRSARALAFHALNVGGGGSLATGSLFSGLDVRRNNRVVEP